MDLSRVAPCLALALCLASHGAISWAAPATHELAGEVVLRVDTTDPAVVQAIARRHEHVQVQRAKGYVAFEATAEEQQDLLASGIVATVDAEATAALAARPGPRGSNGKSIAGFSCYRSVDEANARIDQLVATYPALAHKVDIGDSWKKATNKGGDDLNVIVMSNGAIAGPKPKMFFMAAVHAREYATAEIALRFVEGLLTGYGTDPEATLLLDENEIHVLVESNPDGRRIAEGQSAGSGNSAQRKNANTGYCPASRLGVDLNRNFPFEWGANNGSSGNVCDDTYRGPSAASEPEIQAIDAYVSSIFPDVRGPALTDPAPANTQGVFMDLHSYSGLVLWPWGGRATPSPNAVAFEHLGRRLAYFNGYTPEQSDSLYATDGTSDDNAYGKLGVPAFTIEAGGAFFESCASFEQAVGPTNVAAMRYLATVTRAPYLWPQGPSLLSAAVSPDVAVAGDTVTVVARADDSRYSAINGGAPASQAIASATLTTDAPPWRTATAPVAMSAADGSFNASSEGVVAAIDAAQVGIGRHLVYLQARDAGGSDGPVAAAFVDVRDAATVGDLAGRVSDVATGQPLAATIDTAPYRTTSGADGNYRRHLPPGSTAVAVSVDGYETKNVAAVAITAGQTTTLDAALYRYCGRMVDDADSNVATWSLQTTAGTAWQLAGPGGVFPTRYRTPTPTGNYPNNADASLISAALDLSGDDSATLSFDQVCNTESGFDFGRVEARLTATSPWVELYRCSGDSSTRRVRLSLGSLLGQSAAQIRFRFTSDGGVVGPGFAVDNIRVDAIGPACRASQLPAPTDRMFSDGFE